MTCFYDMEHLNLLQNPAGGDVVILRPLLFPPCSFVLVDVLSPSTSSVVFGMFLFLSDQLKIHFFSARRLHCLFCHLLVQS